MAERRTHRRTGTVLAATTVVLAAVTGAVADPRLLVSVLIGITMVALFFLGTRAPKALPGSTPVAIVFLIVAASYVVRIIALLLALQGLAGAAWLDAYVVGVTVILSALAFSGWLVRSHMTSRQPTLQISPVPQADR